LRRTDLGALRRLDRLIDVFDTAQTLDTLEDILIQRRVNRVLKKGAHPLLYPPMQGLLKNPSLGEAAGPYKRSCVGKSFSTAC